ncbi:MAG: tetratricopeptide repeat protein [Acidobacteriota bacterium]
MRGLAPAAFAAAVSLGVAPAWAQPDIDRMVRAGRALAQEGRFAEAETIFRQALKAKPRQLDCLIALGVALDMQGQYAEARTQFEAAAQVAPQGPPRVSALWAQAVSFAFERRAADAERVLETARAQQKADGDYAGAAASARLIGRIYLESGLVESGRRWYELGYQESRPPPGASAEDTALWRMRSAHAQARLAAREGNADAARRHLEEFETLMRQRGKPGDDNDIYRFVAGYVAYYAKDYDRAIAEFSRGHIGDTFIVAMLGASYEAKGDAVAARRYYERALEITAHNVQTAIGRPMARERLAALGPTR